MQSKADHLLVALLPGILRSISDILQEWADDSSLYHCLKERLLGRFAPSKWQLVFSVLHHLGLGDMKQPQLLDGMLDQHCWSFFQSEIHRACSFRASSCGGCWPNCRTTWQLGTFRPSGTWLLWQPSSGTCAERESPAAVDLV